MAMSTMKKVLIIKSSPKGDASSSNEVADHFVKALASGQGDYQFTIRDLSQTPAPLLDGAIQAAFYTPPEALTESQQILISPSLEMIQELKEADVIVFSSPMHNFSVSSLLKAYIDQICRYGLTFEYGATGPVGLLLGKKGVIISSAGMDFQDEAAKILDFQSPYLQHILGFIGISDVSVVPVQGMDRSDANPEQIISSAKSKIEQLALAV